MMALLKRYRYTLLLMAVIVAVRLINPVLGTDMIARAAAGFREMLAVLPPIFLLLGLLEVWVPREVILRNLGKDSGMRGISLSILLGAVAAGPLYVAFPIAASMLRKGATVGNIAIFLFSWSTLKIPLLLFESSALGLRLTLLRAAINLPAAIILGLLVDSLLPPAEKSALKEKLEQSAVPEMTKQLSR
jgi:uncharacterized membrane protein YraQ (UPF0718 family)